MDHRYSDAEIEALWRVLRERRDMRHFVPAAQADALPEGLIERLVEAAHLAPSVGYMQPWRFLRITDSALRGKMHALVEAERGDLPAALSRLDAATAIADRLHRPWGVFESLSRLLGGRMAYLMGDFDDALRRLSPPPLPTPP